MEKVEAAEILNRDLNYLSDYILQNYQNDGTLTEFANVFKNGKYDPVFQRYVR